MTEQEKRKGGGGKLSRSETVTVRLGPKQRYLAELAARKQRRTLSSFIEWAIEEALSTVHLDQNTSIADLSGQLWDVDEPDRFAKLAVKYEYLLTHEEQVLWKLIRENGFLWRGNYESNRKWTWKIEPDSLIFDRLREHWPAFLGVARGETGKDKLPKWANEKPSEKKTGSNEKPSEKKPASFDDMDDDIPF